MHINNIGSTQFIQKQQNFKGSSASSSSFSSSPNYQPTPLETSKAYTFPQITQGYKEIETFDVPYVGKGKLYELPNGHKIAVIPKAGTFVINTFVKAGHNQGPVIGHFLEHLIADINKKVDGQSISDTLENIGGSRQATTHAEYTNYALNSTSSNMKEIEHLIKIQSEILQKPNISLEKIEKEKGILVSEYAVMPKEENNSEDEKINYLMINQLLNLDEKPNDKNTEKFEPIKLIKETSFSKLTNYYNKYYNNNNMLTIIEGDVNPNEIVKVFSKYFNKTNQVELIVKSPMPDLSTPIEKTKRIDLQPKSEVDKNIQIDFVGPKNNDEKNNFISYALTMYIEDNSSGYKMDKFDTQDYSATNSILRFSTRAETGKEEEELKSLHQKLLDLTQHSISDEDLAALKLKLKDFHSIKGESALVLPNMAGEDFIMNNKFKLFNDFKYIDSLTKQDLQDFAKKYINLNKALVIVAHNEQEIKNAAFTQPTFMGSIKEIDTKSIKEYKYPNNLQLLVDNSEGITRTTYRVNLTSMKIPNVKPGVVKLLESMLEDSTQSNNLSKTTCFKPELKVNLNSIDLSVSVLPEETGNAIAFVNAKLQSPNLNQESLEIYKEGLKAYYKEITKDKSISAMNQLKYANYSLKDTIESLSSYDDVLKKIDEIQLSDVISLYNHIIKNAQGKAILVTSKETFDSQKQNILGQIGTGFEPLQPKQKNNLSNKINIEQIDKTKILIKEEKDDYGAISQSFQIINNGNLKDNLSIKLLSNILGDGTRGRLEDDIRGKQGIAYTAGLDYDADGTLGYFTLGAHLSLDTTTAPNLKTALNSFEKNIENLVSVPVTDIEFQRAKRQFKNDIITWIEFSSGRNELLNEYGLEDTKKLFKILDEITPQDIQKVANTYLKRPSLISINANKEVLNANKDYLSTLGEIVA